MASSMLRWKGKVAIVTGASAGIGAAIAVALVKNGMKVVGLARHDERIKKLAKTLEKEPGKLYAVKADMTKETDILQAFKWTKDNLGPVHVLINNAGIVEIGNLTEVPTNRIRQVFDTNVIGLCIATQEAYKQMKANNINDGHILHINSTTGHTIPTFPMTVYPASKHAVTALTETLRQELVKLGSKIRVTSISPGAVKTEIFETLEYFPPEVKEPMTTIPMLESEDVANSVVYALSTPSHVQIHDIIIRPVGVL